VLLCGVGCRVARTGARGRLGCWVAWGEGWSGVLGDVEC
jgi:hypothetical protein